MALNSRPIPNLINGISQQPPTMRHSSQGEAQENALSTIERGLGKRPPLEHLASLGLATIDIEYVASGAAWEAKDSYTYKTQDHVTLVLNGTLYVLGGQNSGVKSSQVWKTTDGSTWVQATGSAPWQARSGHCGWVFDNKLWIAGGWYDSYPTHVLNDVWWSADGSTWVQATASAAWSIRAAAHACVFDGRMWIMGGSNSLVGSIEPVNVGFGSTFNDVWYSYDGINWINACLDDPTDTTRWSRRHSSQALNFNGAMWVLGGKTMGGYADDVWFSYDGVIWGQATGGAAWQGRYEHAAVTYDNKMWVLGGRRVQGGYTTEGQQFRDVWNSADGATWTLVTNNAEWGYRDEHTATAWDNSIMVIGGWTDQIPGSVPNNATRSAAYQAFKDVVSTTPDHVTEDGTVDFNMSPIATKDAYVHFINRDETEQYVLMIADSTIGVWDLQTGVARSMTAVGGLDYLVAGTPRSSFAVLTVADTTFIVNKTITPAMKATLTTGSITGSVQSFALLPASPSSGQIYKISGTQGSTYDDWYVKYDGAVWVEWVKPGNTDQIDPATMPHKLTRQADGTFVFEEIDWAHRLVGDPNSNPEPSFIGSRLNDIFFYRNRLGFVADEDVILSRAGDFYNFWAQTIQAVLDSDPIDVTVSSSKVSILNYAVPFDKALLLFSNQTQFQMTGGDNLTPKTVRIDPTTSFEASALCRPVGVGPDIYFACPAGTYSRIREYFVQPQSLVNDAADVTAHVSSYVPKNIYRMAGGANENLLLTLASEERNRLYVYKFYWGDGDKKVQSAWSRWTLGTDDDKILGMDIFNNLIYTVTLRDDDVYIERMNLETRITTGDVGFRVYLDRLTTIGGSYDSVADSTSWTLPYTQDAVTVLNADGSVFDSAVQTDSTTLVADGDYSANALYVGVPFTWSYRFSPQYYRDGANQTIISAMVNMRSLMVTVEESGYFEAQVTPKNRTTYVEPFYGVEQGLPMPTAAIPAVLDEGTFRFPALGKNTHLGIELVSETYTPVWVQSAEWEAEVTMRAPHTAGQ